MRELEKYILCLDLGTQTGWATLDEQGKINSGSISFKKKHFESDGVKFLKFNKWLNQRNNFVTHVYFEAVQRHIGTYAAHTYGGFLAILTAWCVSQEIPYEGIGVTAIKKALTGKGNANKELIINAVKALGFNPIDDNEADALAILSIIRS